MRTVFLTIWLIALVSFAEAQEVDKTIQRGNDLYKQQQYQQAEQVYKEAIEQDPNNATAKYNQANAIYKQNKPDEAIRALNDLAFKTENNEMKSKAYYNKGAILSAQKKLEESIEAYKEALRRNPSDKEARENLQKALLELKKSTPPPPPRKDEKKKQQQKQPPQPKMNKKEAEQRLKLLEQKEKEVQQRLQREKSKSGGGREKDW